MKERILKTLTAITLIMTLTMANVLLLCANAVTYAMDALNEDKSTSYKNVEFMAYFKNDNGDKVSSLEKAMNADNLKLYMQISVKQEGYFNGNIVLNDSNFKLNNEILSDGVSKIENNTIYLNQIKAGETKEIETKVEIIKDDKFDLSLLDKNSKITLNGTYRGSTQKDITVTAEKTVNLKLVSPYNKENVGDNLSQEVITNKILNYEGTDKRIIQVQIKSGIKGNLFPIKSSSLEITTPKISDKYPSTVVVTTLDNLITNGKQISNDNWNYNKEDGKVNINIENVAEDNKVSWNKSGDDTIVLTYIFDETTEIQKQDLSVKTQVNLYDANDTKITASNVMGILNEEKDSIITTSIDQKEQSIYKGKLYAGIGRDITYTTNLNVNLGNVANEISLVEENQTISEQVVPSTYKTTRVNKNVLVDLFGENGTLSIINARTNEIISTITKDTESDENGIVTISYAQGVEQIKIKTSAPVKEGKLGIETTKQIGNVSKDVAKAGKELISKINGSYISNGKENKLAETQSSVELKETETSADLQLNRTDISTMSTNNIEMRVVLNSKNENNELYTNPVIRIQLPSKIEKVVVKSMNLVYEDELKIKSEKLLDGNVMEIQLQGQQTKYKEEAVDGATIIINADVTTSKKLPSSKEQISLTYTNEGAVNYANNASYGQVQKAINIVSYAGVVTISKVDGYGVEVVNNEGNKVATLNVGAESKTVKIENEVINNEDGSISNVKVFGTFPTKDAVKGENNIDISIVDGVTVNGIDASRIKTYYSENADATADLNDKNNGWSEKITDNKKVKKYLIVIDKLGVTESAVVSYNVQVPEKLDYNVTSKEGYTVNYTKNTTEKNVDLDYISLNTPKGAVIDTTLKAKVAGNEANQVKENEVLRYEITASNTGSEDISNVKITAKVPDGTVYVNSDKINNSVYLHELQFEDENKKDIEINIDKIAVGETVTKYYEVKINKGMAGKEISNTVNTQYGDAKKTSNEVKTTVTEGKLELQLISTDADDGILYSGYTYCYVARVKNTTQKTIKNINVTINTDNNLSIMQIYYNTDGGDTVRGEENSIEIESIKAGESIDVTVITSAKIYNDGQDKPIMISANATSDSETTNSNQINSVMKSTMSMNITATSENAGEYVKSGDAIKYSISVKNNGTIDSSNVTLNNWIPNEVSLVKVTKNGEELSSDKFEKTRDEDKGKDLIEINEDVITAGETLNYEVETVVDLNEGNTEAVELINEDSLEVDETEVATAKVNHILQPESEESENENENEGNNGNNGENGDGENEGEQTTAQYKIISGTAWIDENEDGQKSGNEKTLEGITVKLLDTTKNEFAKDSEGNIMTVKTTSTGFYSFTKVKKGEYIVIFEYDTAQYGLTAFNKAGIPESDTSKVIVKKLNVDGEDKDVAATEIIKIDNENVANINIGLVMAKKYDLQLDKYISKVTVQNNKTVTKDYNEQTLVKQEIDAKQVNSTTVIVEYTLKVTNKGDVTAYVKKIADYLSSDYKFNSELNKDWYQSGNDVYCTGLANTKIEPGESKEVKLTVIKEMKENNTGLVNNTAEIVSSYNELGLTDINSTEGNKTKGENDMASADLIISIRTGQVVMTVFLVITTVIILGVAIFVIRKYMINGKMM